jgi:hypothetical protein
MMRIRVSQSQSPLDNPTVKAQVLEWVEQGYTNTDIAYAIAQQFKIPTSRKSIARALERWNVERPPEVERPNFSQGDNNVKAVSVPGTEKKHPDDLLKEHGLEPDEWEVTGLKANEWGSPTGNALSQLSVNFKRVTPVNFIVPARTEGYRPTKTKRRATGQPELVVLVGDQQAPFNDPVLHERFTSWLNENEPNRGVLIGDTVDFPDISRHRFNPDNSARVQECIDTGYNLLRDYVQASEQTQWTKLPGNHDERIRNTLIDWAVELYGVRRAALEDQEEEDAVLSVQHLLRLDELGIDFIDPKGPYDQAQVKLSKYLGVRHGWLTKKGAGQSALATLEHLGYSVVVGHTHRQSLVHKTTHDIDGNPTTLMGAEAGCMCIIRDGLGYAVNPDWQNGFATATIWPDGTFKIDLATYFDGVLVWRDQRYG